MEDTYGSLIISSTRAALFTIRPITGLISQKGIAPFSKSFDTAGPIARGVGDLANLLDVLVDPARKTSIQKYLQSLPEKWSEFKVGVLDSDVWYFDRDLQRSVASATKQITIETRRAYQRIKRLLK